MLTVVSQTAACDGVYYQIIPENDQSNITVHRQAFSERFAEIRTRNLGNRDACIEFIPI